MRIIWRWIKGAFWYLVVMAAGIVYFANFAFNSETWPNWVGGYVALSFFLWAFVSRVRSWLRF